MSIKRTNEDLMTSEFRRDEPYAVVMQITREVAKRMLATSPGNRKLRDWYVKQLASSMKRGEWRVTSQGIGIDFLGRLRDAHHRLTAIVESGVTIPSVVVFGLPTDAFEVIDIGIKRTTADLLNEDKRIAEPMRLGCIFALGTQNPSIDQMRPILDAGLHDCMKALISFCGTSKKFYSSSPMRLAAAVTILNGADPDFVQTQYRALCCLDFNSMTTAAQALVRQVDSGKANSNNTRETLARGLRVFDEDRANITKIQVSDADVDSAVALVRSVLLSLLRGHQ